MSTSSNAATTPVRVRVGAAEREAADHPEGQRGQFLLHPDRFPVGVPAPAVREVQGRLGEAREVPFVGRASGEHREQQPAPWRVFAGREHLQVARLAQRVQEGEEFRGPLVEVCRGLQEHGVGGRHGRTRARQLEAYDGSAGVVQARLVAVRPARGGDGAQPAVLLLSGAGDAHEGGAPVVGWLGQSNRREPSGCRRSKPGRIRNVALAVVVVNRSSASEVSMWVRVAVKVRRSFWKLMKSRPGAGSSML